MPETKIGKVTGFFPRPVVAALEISASLKAGDRIHIKGHTTDMGMVVVSMQIDNKNVEEVGAGQSVGIKVSDRVRAGDIVYRVTD